MPGIALSMDEIKAAPPEVRRWLEQEMVRAFGSQPTPPSHEAAVLVGCNIEEARDILALVQDMLPAVNVLFELGREAASVAVHGLRAYSIADIQRHVRLQSPEQVVQCLEVLTQALRRVRGDDGGGVLRAGRPGPLPGGRGDDAQRYAAVAGDRGAALRMTPPR